MPGRGKARNTIYLCLLCFFFLMTNVRIPWKLPPLFDNYIQSSTTRPLFSVTGIYPYLCHLKVMKEFLKNGFRKKNLFEERHKLANLIFYLKKKIRHVFKVKTFLGSHEAPDQAEHNSCQSNELTFRGNISAQENQLCQKNIEFFKLSVWFCYQY